MARVAFFDPFLHILGGGEKVLLTVLEDVAAERCHEVVIMSPRRPDLDRWQRLNIAVDPGHLRWRRANTVSATPLSAGADLFVALVNHFPPLSLARHAAAIVQFPFARIDDGWGPVGRLRAVERRRRLASYDTLVCYSDFVAAEIRTRLHVPDPVVIAPPVDLPEQIPAGPKERKVIAVGRFFAAADANNKKHDVLIDAWRQLEAAGLRPGWELHLVGGVHSDPPSIAYVEQLRERARGAAIRFHPNAPADVLADLYRRSALFWHAAGFGETRAERHEHFGITTVEAMAYGCVPVVVRLGGQLEIVVEGVSGRLWSTVPELVAITRELMSDPEQTEKLRRQAVERSTRFGKTEFVRATRERILEPAGVLHVG
jgi:glycosyltransferase involved in cell wall biosynthesis